MWSRDYSQIFKLQEFDLANPENSLVLANKMVKTIRKFYLAGNFEDTMSTLLSEEESDKFDGHFEYEDIKNDFEWINCRIYYKSLPCKPVGTWSE